MTSSPTTEMLIALAPAIACIVIPLLLHMVLR
jgi:hypothetical protein